MPPKVKTSRKARLKARIAECTQAYYGSDENLVSDAEFDALMEEYVSLGGKAKTGFGYKPNPQLKTLHIRPMDGLTKVRSESQVLDWLNKHSEFTSVVFEPKWDGLAAEVSLKKGKASVVLRGNRSEGENVGDAGAAISNVMLCARSSIDVVYGEIVLFHKDFDNLNAYREQQGLPAYRNPRNAASGIVRGGDLNQCSYLTFIPHDIALVKDVIESGTLKMPRYTSYVLPYKRAVKQAAGIIESLIEDDARSVDVLTDGLVVKSLAEQERPGGPSSNWAVAYKYEDATLQGTIDRVLWSVGMSGLITPVAAMIEPLIFPDADVSRCTLSNYGKYLRLNPNPGDTIHICKSGKIIPFVRDVESSAVVSEITKCPLCEGPASRPRSGPLLFCENMCNSTSRIDNALSRLGVENVRHAAIQAFSAYYYEETPEWTDVLHDILTSTREQWIVLPRYGSKKSAKAIHDLSAALGNEKDSMWLAAAGIPAVGRRTSRKLIQRSNGSFETLVKDFSENNVDHYYGDGIGDACVTSIRNNLDLLRVFLNLMFEVNGDDYIHEEISQEHVETTEHGTFTGKHVVVTGSIPGYTRDEASNVLASYGAVIQSSLNKKTDILVCGHNAGASKTNKANELGTHVIDAEQFLELISA